MTKKELRDIRFYEAEMRLLRRHLKELEAQIGLTSISADGQPHGTGISKPTEQQAIVMADTIGQIKQLEKKIAAKRKEAWDFVSSIEDTLTRQIVVLRFIDGKSWVKVAESVGGDATADGCRMYFNRTFIEDA